MFMKLNGWLKSIFLFTFGMFILASCGDDTDTDEGSPNVAFLANSGDDIRVSPKETFVVRVDASKGDSEMNSLAIQEAGSNIAAERLFINGVGANANPILLFNDERTSFTHDITIEAHEDVSTKVYSIVVTGADGKTKSISLNVNTDAAPPVITTNQPSAWSVGVGANVSIPFSVEKGSGVLKSISVYENDELISDATRLQFAGEDFTDNPNAIAESMQDGFTDQNIVIRNLNKVGANVYKISITDEYDNVASKDFTITVGTAVEVIMGSLLNQSGPQGQGGLDLTTGESVGSSDGHIKDEGNVATTSQEWKKQISGANGSVMKYIVPGTNGISEDFGFGSIALKEDMVSVFEAGVDFTAMNGNGEMVSDVVNVGDLYVIKNSDEYFIIEIADIIETTNDNTDKYEINIRK